MKIDRSAARVRFQEEVFKVSDKLVWPRYIEPPRTSRYALSGYDCLGPCVILGLNWPLLLRQR
eukprot:4785050-Pyramimonas_sp.AAC.1